MALHHPSYTNCTAEWFKYRLTMLGGREFVNAYLKPLSHRENHQDYVNRIAISPASTHAKSALYDINNSVFCRLTDVTRKGGPDNYRASANGEDGGVNRNGSGMNDYMGIDVMPDLLAMAKIGVYVDKGQNGASLLDSKSIKPYLYTYQTEDIHNWSYDDQNNLTHVLLRDRVEVRDKVFGFCTGFTENFRMLTLESDGVHVRRFSKEMKELDEVQILNLKQIPFVIFEIKTSLLKDIADFQIAIMNMNSSDINFSLQANYPFYTEEYDPRSEMANNIQPQPPENIDPNANIDDAYPAGAKDPIVNVNNKDQSADLGTTKGRRRARGLAQPEFIAPPAEPMMASIEKQRELKQEIRVLINLGVSNLKSERSSADSKDVDNANGLEAGLSRIGAILQNGERRIAEIWADYEGSKTVTLISYPEDYTLETKVDRMKQADALIDLSVRIPSKTYRKEALKRASQLTLASDINDDTLQIIYTQIDASPVLDPRPEIMAVDIEAGVLDTETAADVKGYPKGTHLKAQKERTERMRMTAIAQSKAPNDSIIDDPRRGGDSDPTDPRAIEEKNTNG